MITLPIVNSIICGIVGLFAILEVVDDIANHDDYKADFTIFLVCGWLITSSWILYYYS